MMNYKFQCLLLFLSCISCILAKHYKGRPSSFCTEESTSCNISIAQNGGTLHCMLEREKSIQHSRKYYKLTRLGEKKMIEFPFEFIPFLNQSMKAVEFHTALDSVDSKWLSQIIAFNSVIKRMTITMRETFADTNFTQASDYIDVFRLHNMAIKYLNRPELFSNPVLSSTFTEFIYKERYINDDLFVQHRLAGPCPFLLKLVTTKGHYGFRWKKLKRLLNRDFDFDKALQKTLKENKISLKRIVEDKQLFLLYHEENNDIPTVTDYFRVDGETSLMNVTSPIALFVRTRAGDLKVFAIQDDYKNTSTVYTPHSNEYDWEIAKAMVNLGDLNVCQAVWHLSHVHLSSGVYCTIYKSHFSKLHPVHQILQHHCEGTTPHISLTYGLLITPHKYGNKLFSISNSGYFDLAKTGHKKFRYDSLDYDRIMKSHGLDDKLIKYYPFRDDGEVIWKALMRFAYTFTNMYYTNDDDVQGDWELQSFASQISVEGGNGDTYGGKGNIVGFPHVFYTKKEVRTFITRFLWQIVMHAAANYPLEPWGSFIPLNPTKIYTRHNRGKKTIYNALPNMATTIGATGFASLLGNVRMNRIFDYHSKIEEPKLKKLVKKYHFRFHNCIQNLLEKRNERRKKNNEMGFQYFEPKWLTNSIHV